MRHRVFGHLLGDDVGARVGRGGAVLAVERCLAHGCDGLCQVAVLKSGGYAAASFEFQPVMVFSPPRGQLSV